ncbi:MAG: hypothetical protein QM723_24070 [Myxococcaceae bacterium]
MIASLLLTTMFSASTPSVGLATIPRRESAAQPSTLIRVDQALKQQLEQAGAKVKPLGPANKRALQGCSLSAPCIAQVGKGSGVEVVVRADVTVFPDNVALVLTAVSTKRTAIVAQEGFGVSPAHIEDELKERAARFISAATVAAGITDTPPVSAAPVTATELPGAPPPPPPPPLEPAPTAAAPVAELKSEPSPALVPPPPPEPMVLHTERPWARSAGWGFTAGAGALAIASAVFIGLGVDAKSNYDSSLTSVDGLTASRLTADQAHSLANKSNFDLTLGLGLGIAAVVLVGAALIFFLQE